MTGTLALFMDFEASCYGPLGYLIEVAWCHPQDQVNAIWQIRLSLQYGRAQELV